MPSRATVLINDDDPSHRQLYSWIVNNAGFRGVAFAPEDALAGGARESVQAILCDYRLGHDVTAAHLMPRLQATFRDAPIIVLSDLQWIPEDVAKYTNRYVRKGEPEQLIAALKAAVAATPGEANKQP